MDACTEKSELTKLPKGINKKYPRSLWVTEVAVWKTYKRSQLTYAKILIIYPSTIKYNKHSY